MINQASLVNFKCFDDLNLSMRALTVLSGFNAAGKTSATQGLLLITQALRTDPSSSLVPLNGSYVELGTPGDVVRDGGRAGSELMIGFSHADTSLKWSLIADDRTSGLALRTKELSLERPNEVPLTFETLTEIGASNALVATQLRPSIESLRRLVVISAVRPATSDVFPFPYEGSPIPANVGINGQYAAWWFHQMSDEYVDDTRCHPEEEAKTLRRQFAAWAGTLFPGAQANVQHLPRTNYARLELRIGETDEWRRPTNIGYGLTYAFPILVAGLGAQRGQILYIDSPEAHLHPAAQSSMGQFLARIAQSGVQIIVETHSDHVINGIRLAVRNGQIDAESVLFQFFSRGSDSGSAVTVEQVTVETSGRVSAWPPGFFDQIEKDLALL